MIVKTLYIHCFCVFTCQIAHVLQSTCGSRNWETPRHECTELCGASLFVYQCCRVFKFSRPSLLRRGLAESYWPRNSAEEKAAVHDNGKTPPPQITKEQWAEGWEASDARTPLAMKQLRSHPWMILSSASRYYSRTHLQVHTWHLSHAHIKDTHEWCSRMLWHSVIFRISFVLASQLEVQLSACPRLPLDNFHVSRCCRCHTWGAFSRDLRITAPEWGAKPGASRARKRQRARRTLFGTSPH